jgi:hypothetical protein
MTLHRYVELGWRLRALVVGEDRFHRTFRKEYSTGQLNGLPFVFLSRRYLDTGLAGFEIEIAWFSTVDRVFGEFKV